MNEQSDERTTRTETELKLLTTSACLAQLHDAEWLAALRQEPGTSRTLHAVYYDTPDLQLHEQHVLLRVRREGDRFVQCVKCADDEAGIAMSRSEDEQEVTGMQPDAATLTHTAVGDILPEAQIPRLLPLFATEIVRTSWELHMPGDTIVELALDEGEVRAGSQVEALCEIELELKQGDAMQLMELAERIVSHFPARLSRRPKSARGFDLLQYGGAAWSKPARLSLEPHADAEEALGMLMQHHLLHLLDNQECAMASVHPEGVHQMRNAVRRLRTLVSLYRRLLPAESATHLQQELKWLARALGESRDLDVCVTTTLPQLAPASYDDPSLDKLHQAMEAQRTRARTKLQRVIQGQRYAELLLYLHTWICQRRWRAESAGPAADLSRDVRTLADRLLGKGHRMLLKRGRGFSKLPEEEWHRLRRAARRHHYAAEFFAPLYERRLSKPYLRSLSELLDALGACNDLLVAAALLKELVESGTPRQEPALCFDAGLATGTIRETLPKLRRAQRKRWRDFKASTPFWK